MSEIHYSLENNYHVFRKIYESAQEYLFYNKEYFARIGFPDAEITVENKIEGGGYHNPDKLTIPFRQFVYLVQGANDTSSEIKKNDTNNKFIEQFRKYNENVYNFIKSQLNQFSNVFTKSSLKEEEVNVKNDKEEEVNVKNDKEEEVKEFKYWVVKIPVIPNETIEPKGKCEMEEVKLMQTILQRKAERMLPISIEYEYKTIGERVIMLCKRIKDKKEPANDLEFGSCNLEGSVMKKYITRVLI